MAERNPNFDGFISIHALREEGDPTAREIKPRTINFYPRPPRGGRQLIRQADALSEKISIHALREEGDRCFGRNGQESRKDFYPRPPRGGRPI